MNKNLDVLPSPQFMKYEPGNKLNINSICIFAQKTKIIENALSLFAKEFNINLTSSKDADVVIYNISESNCDFIDKSDLEIFNEKFADTQGYIIKKEKNSPVIIAAKTDVGIAYGLMTLLQLNNKDIETLLIYDYPDFYGRGIKWLIWAECGIWAYDFGDGAENYKKRILRKLDRCIKYKINLINADGFGFDTERFPEYSDIMRFLCDEARARGIHISVGGYSSGYGMVGYGNTYQGKGFKNRKSYPDGEIYECIGTYDPYKFLPGNRVDRSVRLTKVRGREWGTCLSNDALFEEKMKELENFVKKTHIGCISFHNMDSHEIHPETWLSRCECCRKKWPNDDLLAKDGMAGAYAHFISKLVGRLHTIKDNDYDADRDLWLRMASPGYLYSDMTEDEDFDIGVKFWGKVTDYLTQNKNFAVGFREEFFYHKKPVPRAETVVKYVKNAKTSIGHFNGCDGFYDDKLFAPNSALNYVMKGYSIILTENGNSFQEPLQLYNAEYLWNCDDSGFYNVTPKPQNYEDYTKVFRGMLDSSYRPGEVYDDGGFLDVICQKLYGKKSGRDMAKIYKLHGKNGEPPIACASNVDIYTNFTKVVYPMRWDNEEICEEEIIQKCIRFDECAKMTGQAFEISRNTLKDFDGDDDVKSDIKWLSDCFEICSMLCYAFSSYMHIYKSLDKKFRTNKYNFEEEKIKITELKAQISAYLTLVDSKKGKPIDKFGGAGVRRRDLGEHLDYWTDIMLSSINTGKRIPADVRPLAQKIWW